MIRAFIARWEYVETAPARQLWNPETQSLEMANAQGRVVNPITEQGESVVTGPFVCSMHYPDADMDGKPDLPWVLVLVEGGHTIENLRDLPGVKMLPAYRFQKPISEIPKAVKNQILLELDAEGIPRAAVADVQVYGDFLRKLARYFNASHNGFGSRVEVDADAEFG